MSLKVFHLFFIAVCVVLAAFVAAWAAQQYQTLHAGAYAFVAAGALAVGGALAFYGAAFQRKTRRLS
jgi:hypothetical protein